jgi:hypothetical protein
LGAELNLANGDIEDMPNSNRKIRGTSLAQTGSQARNLRLPALVAHALEV